MPMPPFQIIPADNSMPLWPETQAEAATVVAENPGCRAFAFADDNDKTGTELDPITLTPLPRPVTI